MPILGRDGLKTRFKNNIGLEAYKALIESTVNLKDDGLEKNEKDGLKLTLTGSSKKLLSFYERMKDSPSWSISLNPDNQEGLSFNEGSDLPRIFLKEGGNMGIDTSDPRYTLDVAGLVAMEGRVGNFAQGHADADGKWHSIIDRQDGCKAFEVMAHINDEDGKRFALTHAIILISKGVKGTRRQIKSAQAGSRWLWGRFFNKIVFAWKLNKEASEDGPEYYDLMIKTRTHYGLDNDKPKQVFYRVTKLWDKEFENDHYPTGRSMRTRPVTRQVAVDQVTGTNINAGTPVQNTRPAVPNISVKPPIRIKKK